MNRLIEKTVFFGLVMACRLATCPTRRSPLLAKPTTDGVVRFPSALGMTFASLPSITATTLLVVPRSIPMILLTRIPSFVVSLPDPEFKSLVALSQLSATPCLTNVDADLFQRPRSREARGASVERREPERGSVEEDEGVRHRVGRDGEELGVEQEVARDRLAGLGALHRLAAVDRLEGVALLARLGADRPPRGGEELGVEQEVARDRLAGLGALHRLAAVDRLEDVALLARLVAERMPLRV